MILRDGRCARKCSASMLVPITTVIVPVAVVTALIRVQYLHAELRIPPRLLSGCPLQHQLLRWFSIHATSKLVLTPLKRSVARSAYPEAALLMPTLEKVATPFTAETDVVVRKAPFPWLVAMRATLLVAFSIALRHSAEPPGMWVSPQWRLVDGLHREHELCGRSRRRAVSFTCDR